MTKEQINDAIAKFEAMYGTSPAQKGYPEIDVDIDKRVYLYARSQEMLDTYILKEKFFRVLCFYFWPITICSLVAFWMMSLSFSALGVFNCIFAFIINILYFILWNAAYKQKKRCLDNILWLNY